MSSPTQATSSQQLIARSYLFVPGDRPDRFDKALAAGADAVIVDLEDAVPPAKKIEARAAIGNWLSTEKAVVLRINADTTEWFRERLLFGTLDFQMDLGIDGEGDELAYYRSEIVLISRLAGIQAPVDGPCTSLDDAAQLTADTRRAKRMGFGGKLCIHPRQVAHVNAAFTPTADELVWARRIVAAAAETKGAAVALDGRMVDRPVILKAEQIVREAALRASKAAQ